MFSFSSLQGSGSSGIALVRSNGKAGAALGKSAQSANKPVNRAPAAGANSKCNASLKGLQHGGAAASARSAPPAAGKAGPGCPLRMDGASESGQPEHPKCVLDRTSLAGKGLRACSSDMGAAGKSRPKLASKHAPGQNCAGGYGMFRSTCKA